MIEQDDVGVGGDALRKNFIDLALAGEQCGVGTLAGTTDHTDDKGASR